MQVIANILNEIRAHTGWQDTDDFLAECAVVLYWRMMYGEWVIR